MLQSDAPTVVLSALDAKDWASRRYHIVLNPKSGTVMAMGLTAEALRASFEAGGHLVTIDADDDASLEDRVTRALESDAEVIVSAGGDGTATALAEALVESDKSLAVLPLGTANLLARDLKIPLQLDEAVAALSKMIPRRIDVGEVNGRVFVHSVVVGVFPSIAAAREKVRGRADIGALLGFAQYFVRRIAGARRTAVAITSRDTEDRVERIHALAVANNAYDEGFGRVFSRTCLDAGALTLYILRRLTIVDVVRLSAKMVTGRWREDTALTIETVRSVTIGARNRTIAVMIDGEVQNLDTPLRFKIRPLGLSVLAPAPGDPSGHASAKIPH